MNTDYTPGDAPVSLGVHVRYNATEYEVTAHQEPADHPQLGYLEDLDLAYPDGVAYSLWPVGLAKKFGNRASSFNFVRRTSFTVVRG